MIQVRIRPGAQATKVVEEVQKALRAEVPNQTPVQLEARTVATLGPKQEWLTISQLNALAAMEESSPGQFDKGYLLFALAGLIALGVFLFWLLRRHRSNQQQSEVRFG